MFIFPWAWTLSHTLLYPQQLAQGWQITATQQSILLEYWRNRQIYTFLDLISSWFLLFMPDKFERLYYTPEYFCMVVITHKNIKIIQPLFIHEYQIPNKDVTEKNWIKNSILFFHMAWNKWCLESTWELEMAGLLNHGVIFGVGKVLKSPSSLYFNLNCTNIIAWIN